MKTMTMLFILLVLAIALLIATSIAAHKVEQGAWPVSDTVTLEK